VSRGHPEEVIVAASVERMYATVSQFGPFDFESLDQGSDAEPCRFVIVLPSQRGYGSMMKRDGRKVRIVRSHANDRVDFICQWAAGECLLAETGQSNEASELGACSFCQHVTEGASQNVKDGKSLRVCRPKDVRQGDQVPFVQWPRPHFSKASVLRQGSRALHRRPRRSSWQSMIAERTGSVRQPRRSSETGLQSTRP
jgi:hypothetical protein